MGKEITCGIFIYDSLTKKILAVQATSNQKLSIPKGHYEEKDGSYLNAAIREVYEETDLLLEPCKIIEELYSGFKLVDIVNDFYEPLSDSEYSHGRKTLKSFLTIKDGLESFPFKCNSFYTGKDLKEYPEVCSYFWITLDEARTKLHYTQSRLIDEIKTIIERNGSNNESTR